MTIPLGYFDRETTSVLDLANAKIVTYHSLGPQLQDEIRVTYERLRDCRWIDYPFPKFCLQTVVSSLKNDEDVRPILDRALIIFKLFKDAHVLSSLGFIRSENVIRSIHWRHYFHWRRVELPTYLLTGNEEAQFAEFWKEFDKLRPENFAVYRFHLADFRPYLRDRFVDYVESLECLLVPDSERGKIGYKFRSRGTHILGRHLQTEARERLPGELKYAYELRSAIVHGDTIRESKLIPTSDMWEGKIGMVRRHDREAIKLFFREKCLDDSKTRSAFLQSIFSTKK